MSTAPRPATNGTAEAPPRRKELVDKARLGWIKKLIDLSRRNNLLFYRPLKTGTLDMSGAVPERMAALFKGETVAVSKLLPGTDNESLLRSVRDIGRRALANSEEKGLRTLFVSLGLATWPADDGGRPTEAPVVLLPVTLETKGSQSFYLTRAGTLQLNLVLLHVLETHFGVSISQEDLIQDFLGDDEGEPFNPQPLYDHLTRSAGEITGFAIKASTILGNFAFQKMAMVKDLQESCEELAAHDMIAAIAGDEVARAAVAAAQQNLDPRQLDRTPPDDEFTVLDADSSQQCAISGVTAGQDAVIHGPPGTGKSQTIVNLVATLAATGSRILFVAEKRAALDVVLHRLNGVGLGHLAIDLHGADLSSKRVMQQVAHTLDKVRAASTVDCVALHKQFADRRAKLNAHDARIHVRRDPTIKSVFEMQGTLLRLTGRGITSNTRWRGNELTRLTAAVGQQVRDLLLEAAGFEKLFVRCSAEPWAGARLPTGEAVQRAVELVRRLNDQILPEALSALHEIGSNAGLRWPQSLRTAREMCGLLGRVARMLDGYSPDIYRQNFSQLLHDLAPGKSGGLLAAWAWCTRRSFRAARAVTLSLEKERRASVKELYSALTQAAADSQQWQRFANDGSSPCATSAAARQRCEAFLHETAELARVFPERSFDECSLDELVQFIRNLAKDYSTPHEIPKLLSLEEALAKLGVGNIVKEIRTAKPGADSWPAIFEHAWLASALDDASAQDPEIRGFKGLTHGRYVDEFTRFDEERIAIAADRVRRAHGERAIAAMNAHPEQEHLIRAEAAKSRRHLPLRRVFSQAADVLTAVCPCWMASPLSVSQLLDSGKQYFDFVIFDEASQVLPEDAVPSILRGKRTIVAGDAKQLPPTTFFAAAETEEYESDEAADAAQGFESLLDMLVPFVRQFYLDWHYRSRDETLISFSNQHIYQNRLVTFPGPGGPAVISHALVQQDPGRDGEEDSSSDEVRRVVELVISHARQRPDETLGVITMGIRHMDRVQAALDRELDNSPDLVDFFDPNRNERFFVKNLERVQGDERDAIIISIGYGKDRAGNLPMYFGPLLSEGGRRRLNVAVTRARRRLTVVSSFSYSDIDLSRVRKGSGVELLRDYLLYASTNGKRLSDGVLTNVPPNDFEAEVFDVLSARGLRLIPQLGASRFRIDMVAEHPSKPGRFVLAIECDGASYHSSYTARDRDRLRQQQLESLGWRFHRIWSTDWFVRKEDEIKRALQSFAEAVEFADKLDRGAIANGTVKARTSHDETTRSARPSRPPIPLRPAITDYKSSELIQLIRWIKSDGQLRTDDEIVTEMIEVLGFSRRGTRIEAAIRRALVQTQAQ